MKTISLRFAYDLREFISEFEFASSRRIEAGFCNSSPKTRHPKIISVSPE